MRLLTDWRRLLVVAALVAAAIAVALVGSRPPRIPGIDRYDGVWIEGPGYEITYGGTYEACTHLCLGQVRCRMVEFYIPEKKCNLYDSSRTQIKGGKSIVGVKQ